MLAERVLTVAALRGDNILPMPDDAFGGWTALQVVAVVLCFVIPLIGWALLARQVGRFVTQYRLGQADGTRTGEPARRTWTVLKEFFGHTRMSRLPVVAAAHWFTALSFFVLFATLVNAFFQLVQPDYRLPLIGHFPPFEWLIEFFAWTGLIGIIVLIAIRQKNKPRVSDGHDGQRSRFFGSTFWQAYYVEFTIFAVCFAILTLRTLEAAMVPLLEPDTSLALHFPLTGWLSGIWGGLSLKAIAQWVYLVAMFKILVSFAWMITISLQPNMGVAWHRFLAFPNIWFKREASGRTALGALKPMTMGDGQVFSLEAMESAAEAEDAAEPVLGVGKVEDFTWKDLLDFSTCTECGRCQSQCPAWNTEKPLSPKLLMMTLREHATAKAPFLRAAAGHPETTPATDAAESAVNWSEVSLIGATGYDAKAPLTAYNAFGLDGGGAVIDEDVLWSCTTCGACVEQCPVDIEHVDHIVDMRRYQTLIESAFPSELGGLFKNLEGKGNPWGMGARARLDWAKDLPFPVKILGQDVEKASEVEWLFWVGCAGAYEDRAKKTTRAVAELLDTAGVTFAVLGDGETCTGDSARRAGNELLFQTLAQQNIETLGEFGVTKIVVTCAHCFNTIKNEYPQVDDTARFEVVHHTQLLNRLVRDKKLVPVSRPSDVPGMSTARNAASTAETVTYHDPCYLGRHNHVYAPPRELIGALPGVELREMPRHGEKSFCCGAGGARMWMEEKLGSRINMNRTEEALATGAERIAIGCPFCRVMISDGLTAKQAEGVGTDVEVVDIAQMLLAAVRRGQEADDSGAAAAVVESTDAGMPSAPAASPAAATPPVATPAAAATPPVATPAASAAVGALAAGGAAVGAAATAATAAAAPAAADPWDDQPAAPASPVTPASAEADPWDDSPATPAPAAAPAPTTAEADPWDDTPATPAAAVAAAPTTTEADPWDDSPATPAPAAAAAPTTGEADPWDDGGDASSSAAADPWDDSPATPAAAVAAAPTTTEPDPWDEPTATPSADGSGVAHQTGTSPIPTPGGQLQSSPDSPSATTEEDPWDDSPATPAAAVAAGPTTTEPDPWDEPVVDAVTTATPEDLAAEGAAQANAIEEVASAVSIGSAPEAQPASPASSASPVLDAQALLDSKDPWD